MINCNGWLQQTRFLPLECKDIIFAGTCFKPFEGKEYSTFVSIKNSKRLNKGNFTLKSNSNKIKLYGGGGNIILF